MTTTISAPFADLAAALRGDLVTPGDDGYDAARAVYNGMIDKRPAAVARCRDAADVIAAVAFARAHGLEIAVRGGGHNPAGFAVWDGSLVVDLSAMRTATVVDVPDVTQETRWEQYRPHAFAKGMRSSLSLPLRVEGASVCALNLYSLTAHAFDDGHRRVAREACHHDPHLRHSCRDRSQLFSASRTHLASRVGVTP